METQSQLQDSRSLSITLWLPVCALAALYGTFTLSWVVYRSLMPVLLTQAGFSNSLASTLLLIEAVIAIALEPFVGRLSDQMAQRRGSRFPLISLGVVLAAVCFVAIPPLALVVKTNDGVGWGLPGLLIAWAIAMSVFRSPAVALLRQYASTPLRLDCGWCCPGGSHHHDRFGGDDSAAGASPRSPAGQDAGLNDSTHGRCH